MRACITVALAAFLALAGLALQAGYSLAGDRDTFTTTLTPCPSNTSDIVYECYAVDGAHPRHIEGSIRARTPLRDKYWGMAFSRLTYEYKHAERPDGSCVVESAAIDDTCKVDMPVWNQPSNASEYTIGAWNSMFQALLNHELTHCKIARESAADLEKRMVGATAASCYEMDKVVKSIYRKVLVEYQAKQAAYDAQTNHGILDGVDIPMPNRKK